MCVKAVVPKAASWHRSVDQLLQGCTERVHTLQNFIYYLILSDVLFWKVTKGWGPLF